MSRLTLNHLAWSKTTPGRLRHNLANSAVATPDLEAMGLPYQATLPSSDPYALMRRLEDAIASRYKAPGGRVVVMAGASEANASVFAGLLSPGDGVLCEKPGYEPHRAVCRVFGARLATYTRSYERAMGGVANAVRTALTDGIRLVVVSDVHNPSGAPLSDDDASELEALAEEHDFKILCDETFRDSDESRPCATRASRGPRWIATSTLTKSYGLGGLRIGWVAGSADTLARCADAQNALTVEPSYLSLQLALDLMPHLDTLRARSHKILAANRAAWAGFVAITGGGASAGLDLGVPSRGTTTWGRFKGSSDGDEFAALCIRHDLAVVPGGFFGDPRGVRISLCNEPAAFRAALEPLGSALEAFASATRVRTGA
jgi:aspartate/methionine/tyrosine aminotransferase